MSNKAKKYIFTHSQMCKNRKLKFKLNIFTKCVKNLKKHIWKNCVKMCKSFGSYF